MEIEENETVKSSEGINCNTLRSHVNAVRIILLLIITIVIIFIGNTKNELKFSPKQKIDFYTTLENISNQSKPADSPSEFDIVLSYYTENVHLVARYINYLRNILNTRKIQSRTIVYTKNNKENQTYLKEVLKADIVILLDNVGREGATFLHHIIENYNSLANHILFSQAGVEGMNDKNLDDWFLNRLEKQFNSSVGYMPLVVDTMISIYDCGSHPSGQFLRLVDLWGMLQQTLCPLGGQAVAFRGQFLVSGKRIRSRSLGIYQYINQLITANSAHWIHKDPKSPNWGSSPDAPIFGHTVERLWTVLFNCTNPDLHERCKRNDCACFD